MNQLEEFFKLKKEIKAFNLRNIDFYMLEGLIKKKEFFEFLNFLNKLIENDDFDIKNNLKVVIAGPLGERFR